MTLIEYIFEDDVEIIRYRCRYDTFIDKTNTVGGNLFRLNGIGDWLLQERFDYIGLMQCLTEYSEMLSAQEIWDVNLKFNLVTLETHLLGRW